MKNTHNNNAATKTLEDIIAPKRCQQEPATKGNSKHAKNATRQITEHTVKNTTAEVCYLCAAPTIIEEHRAQTPTQDRTKNKEILLHDIRQIAQCTNSPSSLDFLFKKRNVQNTTPKKPWISSPHIGKSIIDDQGRRGQIITNAPSRQKETEPTETTHFVKFKKENRQEENDTIDECEELTLTQIIQGLAQYEIYLNNLITTNREYSPENSDEETMEGTRNQEAKATSTTQETTTNTHHNDDGQPNPESNSDTSKQNTHKKSRRDRFEIESLQHQVLLQNPGITIHARSTTWVVTRRQDTDQYQQWTRNPINGNIKATHVDQRMRIELNTEMPNPHLDPNRRTTRSQLKRAHSEHIGLPKNNDHIIQTQQDSHTQEGFYELTLVND